MAWTESDANLRSRNILVTGAGGFIGGHLVKKLLNNGHNVFAVDIKPINRWWQLHHRANNYSISVRDLNESMFSLGIIDDVYHLAANMGGIGYITNHLVKCSENIVDTIALLNMCQTDQRIFFSSSACVYPQWAQINPNVGALREDFAIPADPEPGYGWEKLYGEHVMQCHNIERHLQTRIGRYHNIFGPHGSWNDGHEKAPAALCRKVAQAVITKDHTIDIWGDGEQTRSFLYVDDCVDGTIKITNSNYFYPFNVGSEELISINGLLDIIEEIANVKLTRYYQLDKPQGVRGRNSDSSLIKAKIGWEPTTSLRSGIETTYEWIYDQVKGQY